MWQNVELLRRNAKITFLCSIGLVPIAAFVLYIGAGRVGGGHGTYTVWFIGLGLCGLSWLSLAASACFRISAFVESGKLSVTIVVTLLLLIPSTLLGLWGLQG